MTLQNADQQGLVKHAMVFAFAPTLRFACRHIYDVYDIHIQAEDLVGHRFVGYHRHCPLGMGPRTGNVERLGDQEEYEAKEEEEGHNAEDDEEPGSPRMR